MVSDTAHPEVEATAVTDDPVANTPSGYYHVPTEDAEIEAFLVSYGNDGAAGEADEVPAAESLSDEN